MEIELVFLFLLPLLFLLGGFVSFYKAYSFWSQLGGLKNAVNCPIVPGGLSVLSGNPKADNPMESYGEMSPCIYSKLFLEYFEPKRKQWIPINTFVKKGRFSLMCQDKEFVIDPLEAKFDVKNRLVFQEAKKTTFSSGMVGEIQQLRRSSEFMRPLEAMGRRAEPSGTAFDSQPFDAAVYAALESEPDVRNYLLKYNNFRKRATIETIRESHNVIVIGHVFPQENKYLVSKREGIFLISSDTIQNIMKHTTGRAILSVVIGIGLVLVSFALAFFISS